MTSADARTVPRDAARRALRNSAMTTTMHNTAMAGPYPRARENDMPLLKVRIRRTEATNSIERPPDSRWPAHDLVSWSTVTMMMATASVISVTCGCGDRSLGDRPATGRCGCFVSATAPRYGIGADSPRRQIAKPTGATIAVHETMDDLATLQAMLDRSMASAGEHLHEVITADRVLTAVELVERLTGMCLLVLATTTADGRPIAGPVDGIFYRGQFWFGSSPTSVRFRHIAARPSVSATHLPGEELAVTVHGSAATIDVQAPEHAGFRRTLLDIYVPRYGADWEKFLDGGPQYARIDARRMFTFSMPPDP